MSGNNSSSVYNSNRIYGLDIFRATAILLVIVTHGNGIIGKELEGFPWIPLPDGVELFFVLSGFLIGQIVLRDFNPGMRFGQLLFFWKRRWYRTLPNYYLVLILNIIFTYFAFNGNSFENYSWKFWLFMQNLWGPFMGFFWESWSLSVEEYFYLIFPLLSFSLLIFSKYSKKAIFLFTILSLIILPLLYKFYLAETTNVDQFWWDVSFRKVVITRLDTVIYGVLMAFVKKYYFKFWNKSRIVLFVIGLVLLIINLYIEIKPNAFYSKTFYFIVNSVGAALLIPLMDSIKSGHGIIHRAVTWISKISVYLVFVVYIIFY